jgi:hypothetical protein
MTDGAKRQGQGQGRDTGIELGLYGSRIEAKTLIEIGEVLRLMRQEGLMPDTSYGQSGVVADTQDRREGLGMVIDEQV